MWSRLTLTQPVAGRSLSVALLHTLALFALAAWIAVFSLRYSTHSARGLSSLSSLGLRRNTHSCGVLPGGDPQTALVRIRPSAGSPDDGQFSRSCRPSQHHHRRLDDARSPLRHTTPVTICFARPSVRVRRSDRLVWDLATALLPYALFDYLRHRLPRGALLHPLLYSVHTYHLLRLPTGSCTGRWYWCE